MNSFKVKFKNLLISGWSSCAHLFIKSVINHNVCFSKSLKWILTLTYLLKFYTLPFFQECNLYLLELIFRKLKNSDKRFKIPLKGFDWNRVSKVVHVWRHTYSRDVINKRSLKDDSRKVSPTFAQNWLLSFMAYFWAVLG